MILPAFHHATAFAFGVLGNIVSFLVYLSPIPTFYRICRKKSTEGFDSLPYLVALFSSMLWLYYAMLKGNAMLLITINSFGCVIEMVYIILYITYATRYSRKLTIRYFIAMNLGAFSFFILMTRYAAPPHLQVAVFGWICVAVSVCVFASPLSVVAQVIRTKSVEFMPFYLSLFLTLGAVMWFGFGFFSQDKHVYIPNIIGFLLGISQMVLHVIYRRQPAGKVIAVEKLPESHPFPEIIIAGSTAPAGETQVYQLADISKAPPPADGREQDGTNGATDQLPVKRGDDAV
ncbi:hypothetical protein SAY86_031205 [Trapa natans]|uniref:Bidirectional sugar transporter SWEET n=1 Tax=Trapa natans TaxID=22666 RepID=A0AAN7M2R7_TRANT|nr:hypothetical protein SAY86_031205 [Trapa natans]